MENSKGNGIQVKKWKGSEKGVERKRIKWKQRKEKGGIELKESKGKGKAKGMEGKERN